MTLKLLRIAHDMSISDVAKVLNLSREAYRRRECGEIGLKLEEGVKLAALYNVTLEEIYLAMLENHCKAKLS